MGRRLQTSLNSFRERPHCESLCYEGSEERDNLESDFTASLCRIWDFRQSRSRTVEAQEISWTFRFGIALQFDLTITLPEQETDLYTAIATQIESPITVEIPT